MNAVYDQKFSESTSGERGSRIDPVLARSWLLVNGGQDTVVETAAQLTFCANVNAARPTASAGRCVATTLPQARHSVLVEADIYRQPALARTLAFFDCVRRGGAAVCR